MGYRLGVPDLTTIKVPTQVRDRFAAAAQLRGISVRALLEQLSRQVSDATLMEQAALQQHQLRETDPQAWEDYLAEGEHWEHATIEPLDG